MVVLNKSDRVNQAELSDLEKSIDLTQNEKIISISAEKGENIDDLTRLLLDIVNIGSLKHQDVVINIRHYNALKSSSEE